MTDNQSPVPFDEDMERATIGAVLINPDAYITLASFLQGDDFYLLRHQYIWDAFGRLTERQEAIERKTLRRDLTDHGHWEKIGGDGYISKLMNSIPTAMYAEQHARLVQRDAVRRKMLAAADAIRGHAQDPTISVEDVIASSEKAVWAVSERTIVKNDYISARDSVSRVLDDLNRSQQEREGVGLPTGLKRVDALLGGFHKSDLMICAGRPGMGKTSFAMSIARNVCVLGGRVGYFSLEMGNEQLTQRLASMETGTPMNALRTGKLNDKQMRQSVEALGRISEWQLFMDDSPSLTPSQLRTKAHRMNYMHGLDLLIVDYLQLMHAPGFANRVLEIGYISRHLKELARELHVPLLANAQLSRAVEQRKNKRPVLSDLRESGSIENDADIVMFLYRDVVYNEATENPNQAEVIVAKHRNGPTDTVLTYFDASSTRFLDGSTRNIDLSQL